MCAEDNAKKGINKNILLLMAVTLGVIRGIS